MSVPLPSCPPAPQLPITAPPVVVITLKLIALPRKTVVVPTAPGAAKFTERVKSVLFDEIRSVPFVLVAALITPA